MCSDVYYFIVRKNFVFFMLLTYQFFLTSNIYFCMAVWVPPEEMARQYKHIGEDNFNLVTENFENLLKLDRLEKISDNSLYESMCYLERIKVINWSKIKKQDVADFLLEIAVKMLNKENYLKDTSPKPSKPIVDMSIRWVYYDLLLAILETHGYLSDKLNEKDLNMIWEKYTAGNSTYQIKLKDSLLKTAAEQIRLPESVKLLEKWKITGSKLLTNEQLTIIDRYIAMHEFTFPKNEKEAWEIFWNQIKPEPVVNVVTANYLTILLSKLMDIKWSRRTLDAHIVMKIINETDDFYKKYAFVQIAMFMNNANYYPLLENRTEYYLKLESIIKKMSIKIDQNIQLKSMNNFLDYNKIHIESCIKGQKKNKRLE